MKKIVIMLLISLFVFTTLQSADLEETLESLSGEAAESYVKPIVSAFGTNLNGGWYHWAPKDKFLGFDVEFGMVMMGTMFPDDDKSFEASGTFQFTESQANDILLNSGIDSTSIVYDTLIQEIIQQEMDLIIHGATIIGDEDDHVIVEYPGKNFDINGQTYTVDAFSMNTGIGGLLEDFSMLPMIAPQLSLGTFYGTKASFRFVPSLEVDKKLGKLDYFGFGIQHNPKAWFKVPLPVDFCFSYFTQSMKLADIVEANATAFGLNVSKTFGVSSLSLTPYAGYMFESSNMEFKYKYEIGDIDGNGIDDEPVNIKFDIDGKNKNRITLGTTFRLGFFNFNADYNIGKYNSFTAGFALGF